tara:strand:- start:9 stop:506 length:498 start_codon:yes stop_codon:yes gene_type:complete
MAPKIKNRPPPVVRLLAAGVLCIFLSRSASYYWYLLLKSGDLQIDSLLSTELIASVIICGAFFMAIRTIMGFTRDVSELRPKLVQLENTHARLREALTNNKELVGNLSQEVEPIQDLEAKMRAHYEVMQDLQLEDEKQRLAAEEEADTGRKKRVQRKKMGFGESD